MKKTLILFALIHYASASPVDEVLLKSCQATGHVLYSTCVATPPVTPEQVAACTALYSQYMICSTSLNAPQPMLPSKSPDPYTWSPYDPCRFEVHHYILWDICPSSPVGY